MGGIVDRGDIRERPCGCDGAGDLRVYLAGSGRLFHRADSSGLAPDQAPRWAGAGASWNIAQRDRGVPGEL